MTRFSLLFNVHTRINMKPQIDKRLISAAVTHDLHTDIYKNWLNMHIVAFQNYS